MSARIALIGPGAVGGSIAAHLIAARSQTVTLIVRTPVIRLAVVLPDGTKLESSPDVLDTPKAPPTPFDWVFVATKAYDVTGTIPWLNALVGPTTRVAILQNGVEHRERFKTLVPADQLLPVMVDLPAERTAPGQIRQRGKGILRAPDTADGRAFVDLFKGTALDVATEADFTTALWRKLTLNAPGALNALLLQPNRIYQIDAVAALARNLMLEVIAVARAEGAELEDGLADEILARQRASSPDGANSLYADRLAGRPMEVDARNGAVVRTGRRHGIPTPLNSMATTLLEALQPDARSDGAVG